MNRFPMLFAISPILLLLLTTVDEATAKCDANSYYDECANQCTAPNCPGKLLTCPLILCQAGCKCKKGFIQLYPGRGPCVPKDKCPPSSNCTGKYEHWEYGFNWCCPPTCQKPHKQICFCGPKSACICNKGYVRSKLGGPCIPIAKCPKNATCGKNEHWETGSNWCCPPTCQNPDDKKQCKCGPKGDCICNKGYVRSKLDGPCISIDKCPKDDCCGDNEEPTNCGNVCIEPNCPGVVVGCPKNCQPGVCKCKKGYVRLNPGIVPSPCVLKEKCPKSNCTGKHEFWDTGKNWCCPRTCDNYHVEILRKCTADGGRCNCAPGYIRPKKGGPCIPKSKCCKKPHEIWRRCANGCEPTCKNRNPKCPENCPVNGGCECDAKNGFIRASKYGDCIKMSTCPKIFI